MSKALIDKLRKQRDADRAAADTILAKAETGELSDTEKSNLDALTGSATTLDARIKELTEMEMARLQATELDNKLDRAFAERSAYADPAPEKPLTLGEQFTASSVYSEYIKQPTGKSGLFTTQMAALETNGVPQVDRASDSPMPRFVTPLLDAIGYEPVSSGSIDWISWPALPPEAGNVAEGDPKPEAVYAPLLNTAALDKQAHHLPVTREMLEDVDRAQSIITGALQRGVRKKIEIDAVTRLVTAVAPESAEGETLLTAIRVGVGLVSENGWDPNVVALNPLDYAQIDIDLLDYTVNGAVLGKSIWGLRVVPSAGIPADTAFVLDGTNAMTLFDRRVTNVYITDSHADEFTSNILRILAEARTRTEIIRPEAIAKCTVVPPIGG